MTNLPFNGPLYIQKQTQMILDRLSESSGSLYLEIEGSFLVDQHAARVLPGYIADSKAQIFQKLAETIELSVIFCINAKDVVRDRQLGQKYISFEKHLFNELDLIKSSLGTPPLKKDSPKEATKGNPLEELLGGDGEGFVKIVFTMLDYDFIPPHIRELKEKLQSQGYSTHDIYNQPGKTDMTRLSHTLGQQSLTLIGACGGGSGQYITAQACRDQDIAQHIDNQYALYTEFPLHTLSETHPLNLAYQASVADIAEEQRDAHITLDTHILDCLSDDIESKKKISDACREEIQSRIKLYNKLLLSGHGEEEAVTRCEELLKKF